jgi:hypothetical protein
MTTVKGKDVATTTATRQENVGRGVTVFGNGFGDLTFLPPTITITIEVYM